MNVYQLSTLLFIYNWHFINLKSISDIQFAYLHLLDFQYAEYLT